jgi:kumamolisin
MEKGMFHSLIEAKKVGSSHHAAFDDANHHIDTTWVLNRSLSEKELGDFKFKVAKTLRSAGLLVTSIGHDIRVTGKVSDFNKVIRLSLAHFTDDSDGSVFVAPKDDVEIPCEWKHDIVHIFGLSTEKVAKSVRCIVQKPDATRAKDRAPTVTPFSANELARLYNFPEADGTGQKIGIIELGGGFTQSDLVSYMKGLGLADNSVTSFPNVIAVSVDGARNNPSDPNGASVEVVLDIEVVLAVVPKASINVYFAQNSDSSFYNAIAKAVQDGCKVISISWGLYESGWTSSAKNSFNALFQSASNAGVTILCSAGDNGSSDGTSGTNVDFPASSPFAVACGGTSLQANADRTAIISETVWNNNPTSSATGGGYSTFFAQPAYQQGLNTNGKRGLPDVSAVADPNTGYRLIYQGQSIVVGGTSAVSPLLSGLVARINQLRNTPLGLLQSTVYSASPSVCRDVTSGNNGAYTASTGWDPASGLGVIDGTLLYNFLTTAGSVPVPPPGPTPVPPPVTTAPVAQFFTSSTTGVAPLRIQFVDSSTNNPTSWQWDFGDKSQSVQKNPVKIYSAPGTYTVTLSATNAGGTGTLTKQNLIKVNAPPVLKASFTTSRTSGKAPLAINFRDTSTGSPVQWRWTFSDGTSSVLRNPTKIFTKVGLITCTLTVTNALGTTSSATNYVTVQK